MTFRQYVVGYILGDGKRNGGIRKKTILFSICEKFIEENTKCKDQLNKQLKD